MRLPAERALDHPAVRVQDDDQGAGGAAIAGAGVQVVQGEIMEFNKGDFVILKTVQNRRGIARAPFAIVTAQPRSHDVMQLRLFWEKSAHSWSQSFWIKMEPETIRELSKFAEYAYFLNKPLAKSTCCTLCKRPF